MRDTYTSLLTLIQPDDWHLHLRDGPMLKLLVPHAAAQFDRAIVMPNLTPPITTTEQAVEYRTRILAEVPLDCSFTPLMTLYMTDKTTPCEIRKAVASGIVFAVKLYPAGSTTNSESGVTDMTNIRETLETMATLGLPLCVHGEVTDQEVDVFDREAQFIKRVMIPLVKEFPTLRIVMEHITTSQAVQFVQSASPNVAATITPHHLLYNRTALFQGGLHPHLYCLPVLKAEHHRQALLDAIRSGSSRFFIGSDSAPHVQSNKESDCGCAGIYMGLATLSLYAEAFEQAGCLSLFEQFASYHGPRFYRLPINRRTITLQRQPWIVPPCYSIEGVGPIIPLRANESVDWRIVVN